VSTSAQPTVLRMPPPAQCILTSRFGRTELLPLALFRLRTRGIPCSDGRANKKSAVASGMHLRRILHDNNIRDRCSCAFNDDTVIPKTSAVASSPRPSL
jgi:hypothetical protein